MDCSVYLRRKHVQVQQGNGAYLVNTAHVKEPVMNISIQKSVTSKGIKCTAYDPRLNYNSKDDLLLPQNL